MQVAKYKASEATLDESLTSSDGSLSLERAAELNEKRNCRYRIRLRRNWSEVQSSEARNDDGARDQSMGANSIVDPTLSERRSNRLRNPNVELWLALRLYVFLSGCEDRVLYWFTALPMCASGLIRALRINCIMRITTRRFLICSAKPRQEIVGKRENLL